MKNITFKNENIENLDLDPIKFLLMNSEGGPMWSKEMADHVEVLYKSFLFLLWKYPEEQIVPTPEVDEFWHFHILDTKKYFQDCDAIFGRYMHHNPHKGLNGIEDRKDLNNIFDRTLELVDLEFPEFREAN